jgi:hypothetical protein
VESACVIVKHSVVVCDVGGEEQISVALAIPASLLTSMNFSLLRSKSWSSSTPRYEYFLKDRDAFLAAASSPVVYWSACLLVREGCWSNQVQCGHPPSFIRSYPSSCLLLSFCLPIYPGRSSCSHSLMTTPSCLLLKIETHHFAIESNQKYEFRCD